MKFGIHLISHWNITKSLSQQGPIYLYCLPLTDWNLECLCFRVDVYSFLATSSSAAINSLSVAELINESKADSTSQGILSQDYAARVICVLSQAVDK